MDDQFEGRVAARYHGSLSSQGVGGGAFSGDVSEGIVSNRK
jgi:hypothetical protein